MKDRIYEHITKNVRDRIKYRSILGIRKDLDTVPCMQLAGNNAELLISDRKMMQQKSWEID